MNSILANSLRFIGLVLIQVFVINQIDLGFLNSYISLSVYVSFLLTFSTKLPKYITMLVALGLGLCIDMFLNTEGIHASSCLFLALVRPLLLRRIQTTNPLENVQELTVYTEDIQKYALYCVMLLGAFFFWLFLLEEFSILALPLILLKTILSTIFTTLLIIVGQYLLYRKPKN
jgi:hypothetical protein